MPIQVERTSIAFLTVKKNGGPQALIGDTRVKKLMRHGTLVTLQVLVRQASETDAEITPVRGDTQGDAEFPYRIS